MIFVQEKDESEALSALGEIDYGNKKQKNQFDHIGVITLLNFQLI